MAGEGELTVDALVKEVTRLRRRIFELEEENDLLAVENERLRSLSHDSPAVAVEAETVGSATTTEPSGIFGALDEQSYLHTGSTGASRRYANLEHVVVTGAGNGLNPLCCRIAGVGGLRVGFVGGVDKMLTAFALEGPAAGKQIGTTAGFDGPVLSIDIRPSQEGEGEGPLVLLVTCMDGAHALVEVLAEGGGDSGSSIKMDVVYQAKEHVKYAVVGRWSPDGSMYATGSHDKSAKLFKYYAQGHDKRAEMLREFYFSGNVEALAFVRPVDTRTGEPWLIISTRGLPYLTYVGCVEGERREVSLNASEWDTHVSFTVLSMASSPCGRYLLVATDKSRLIVYRMGTNNILRNLYGHGGDEYSNPRAVWHPSGKFISCNSQQPHQVVTWCVSSERVVGHLTGHTSTIRDVHCEPSTGMLATVAYDKTLRVYAPPPAAPGDNDVDGDRRA